MLLFLFFVMTPPPPRSTLFPYTTLFRSQQRRQPQAVLLPQGFGVLSLRRRRRALERAQAAGRLRRSDRTPKRSEEHTSELQSLTNLVCRLLLEKKKKKTKKKTQTMNKTT